MVLFMMHLLCLLVSRVVDLRQCICAAICSSELVAFGMDINGKDE